MHQHFEDYEDEETTELDFENGLRFDIDEEDPEPETTYYAPGWCGRPRTEKLNGC